MTLLHGIIEAVADAKGKEPVELDIVLADHISTEAIQRLDEHESDSWTIQFELPDHTVEVVGDGTIHVDGTQKERYA
ncbi:HalOD1 output domain-containing protein [Natronomonas sp.]|uniref:HalOD1 output domain-containing protein n=1 Tax=Natronomonas sp. TaxID=2184060 RepID=UPI002FC27771